MNVFDRFLTGDMKTVDLNLSSPHFNESLSKNSIKREDMIQALLYEEIEWWESGYNNRFNVYYSCEALNTSPMNKDHEYFKVVLGQSNNSIYLVTIIPQTNLFRDLKSKRIDKKLSKAFSKRNCY